MRLFSLILGDHGPRLTVWTHRGERVFWRRRAPGKVVARLWLVDVLVTW